MKSQETKPVAYVGITGFKEGYEVRNVAEQYLRNGFLGFGEGVVSKKHKAMFGFICSAKRLVDKSKQGRESARAQDLGSLAKYTPRGIIPMIHYYTPNRRNLAEEVKEVFSIDGMYENNYCRAVQINMPWPDIDQVELIRKEFPEMDVVLWLPKVALTDVSRVEEYGGLVQYCLIDPSGGEGREIGEKDLGLAGVLQEFMPNTRIGIAGGLYGGNVNSVMRKVYRTLGESFCIDSQGKMRTEDKYGFDFESVADYISMARDAICKVEKF